jgi:hypothetical protein
LRKVIKEQTNPSAQICLLSKYSLSFIVLKSAEISEIIDDNATIMSSGPLFNTLDKVGNMLDKSSTDRVLISGLNTDRVCEEGLVPLVNVIFTNQSTNVD